MYIIYIASVIKQKCDQLKQIPLHIVARFIHFVNAISTQKILNSETHAG